MLDVPTIAVKGINTLYKLKILDASGNVQLWFWGSLCLIAGVLLLASALKVKEVN